MLSAAFLLGHRKRLGTFSGTFGSCSCGNVACADFAAGASSPPCQGTALCCCGLLHANVLLTRPPVARLCLEMRSWVTRLLAPGDEGTRSDRADKDLCGVSGGRGDSFGMPAGMSTESLWTGPERSDLCGPGYGWRQPEKVPAGWKRPEMARNLYCKDGPSYQKRKTTGATG